eukprot:gene14264-16870_t
MPLCVLDRDLLDSWFTVPSMLSCPNGTAHEAFPTVQGSTSPGVFKRAVQDLEPHIREHAKIELGGLQQSFRYFEECAEHLRAQLSFVGPVEAYARKYMRQFTPSGALLVGIHVAHNDDWRLADENVTHGGGRKHRFPPSGYFMEAMAKFRRMYQEVRFIVVSDDPRWCLSQPLFQYPDVTVVRHRAFTREDKEILKGLGAAVDMAILSRCDDMILTTGSKSWWTAWLGRRNGRVIYYQNEFEEGTLVRDYFPDSWQPLGDHVELESQATLSALGELLAASTMANSMVQNAVCIILPIRDRDLQVDIFKTYIRRQLISENIQSRSVVVFVEQTPGLPFNRGLLLNVGYLFLERGGHICTRMYTHDVDMHLQGNMAYHNATMNALGKFHINHLSARASQFKFKMPYEQYMSGIVGFAPALYKEADGYPNSLWGWGGEDDVLFQRVKALNATIHRKFQGRVLSLRQGHTKRDRSHTALKDGIMLNQSMNRVKGIPINDGLQMLQGHLSGILRSFYETASREWRLLVDPNVLYNASAF